MSEPLMTVDEWLDRATKTLQAAGVGTARLDAQVLLEDALHTDRAQLLAHPETALTAEQQKHLRAQLARRARHEPLAYVRGKTEFYGRELIITPAVLEPRPESETMIDVLMQLPAAARKTVVDVGTGSGALAITAALELSTVQVIATDIDSSCLTIARRNCTAHKVTVDLRHTDLLEGISLPAHTAILANLPYVPNDYRINDAAMMEPRVAIFGGEDGLDIYRQLFNQLRRQTHQPEYVLTESLPFQHKELAAIARSYGYDLSGSDDFIQIFKPKLRAADN